MRPRLTVAAAAVLALLAGAWPGGAQEAPQTQGQNLDQVIRDYLMNNPQVLLEALVNAQQWQETQRMTQNADRLFHSPNAYVAGNPEGDITLVEFFDYNCGYCKRAMDDVLAYMDEDSNVRVVMREFPILGPGSLIASRAALASREQGKYWEFHLAMMRAPSIQNEAQVMEIAESVGIDVERLEKDMKDPAILAAISEGHELAQVLGIQGTPTFVLDDRIVQNSENLKEALATATAEIRANGGCTVC